LRELSEFTAGAIQAHLGAIEFGFLIAAFMATRAPLAMFSGFLSDLFGIKRTMILGMPLNFIAHRLHSTWQSRLRYGAEISKIIFLAFPDAFAYIYY